MSKCQNGECITRDEFLAHLRAGKSATLGVQHITGIMPHMVTLASYDEEQYFQRWSVMMAGDLFAAITQLHLRPERVPPQLMDRIRAGEPCGAVLEHMDRYSCTVQDFDGGAIKAHAFLKWNGIKIGQADEVFSETLGRRLK